MNIKVTHRGDFSKVEILLNKCLKKDYLNILDKYGKMGVEALRAATPVNTGKTSESWEYTIEESNGKTAIVWSNRNINKHVNIAMILQLGHATGTGGWVEGIDYINPALKPIFDKLASDAWKEVVD